MKEDVSNWREGCPTPHHHKHMMLTPSFLRDAGIKYEMVVQRPGDLVYVGCLVYHQVVNFGVTLAEAVNVGGSDWNHSANRFISCQCPGSGVEFIRRRNYVYEVVKAHKIRIYECQYEGCSEIFDSPAHYNVHTRNHLFYIVNPYKAICVHCNNIYMNQESLRKHVERQHPPPGTTFRFCPLCFTIPSAGNYSRHVKKCHPSSQPCK